MQKTQQRPWNIIGDNNKTKSFPNQNQNQKLIVCFLKKFFFHWQLRFNYYITECNHFKLQIQRICSLILFTITSQSFLVSLPRLSRLPPLAPGTHWSGFYYFRLNLLFLELINKITAFILLCSDSFCSAGCSLRFIHAVACISILFFFKLLSMMSLYGLYHCFCISSPCWWEFAWFPVWGCCDVSLNTHLGLCMDICLHFFGWVPRNEITGLYGKCIFNFMRSCQSIF